MQITTKVDDLSEAIKSLPSLISSLQSLSIFEWTVVITLFLWLATNKKVPTIIEAIKSREKEKLDQLDSYIFNKDFLDENTAQVVRDMRDARHFRIATGIYAERRQRNALIKLHKATCHKFSWRNIRRAQSCLEINEDETIQMKTLSKFDLAGYWYNQLIGYVFLLLPAVIFTIIILSETKTTSSLLTSITSIILCIVFSMFVFSQNWPVQEARRITKEIESQRRVAHRVDNATASSTTANGG